eukprot:scaffold4013_cov140-Isochrysis_galbana.AAC.2
MVFGFPKALVLGHREETLMVLRDVLVDEGNILARDDLLVHSLEGAHVGGAQALLSLLGPRAYIDQSRRTPVPLPASIRSRIDPTSKATHARRGDSGRVVPIERVPVCNTRQTHVYDS